MCLCFVFQSHPEGWVELGYSISYDDLNSESYTAEMTSVYSCFRKSSACLSSIHDLISGDFSLGKLVSDQELDVVPSPSNPFPGFSCKTKQVQQLCFNKNERVFVLAGKSNYYSGGLITNTHGSKNGSQCDAIQIECPSTLRRANNLEPFAAKLAVSLHHFLKMHYSDWKN